MDKQKQKNKNLFQNIKSKCNGLFVPIVISFICILALVLLIIGFNYFRNAKTIEESIESYNMQINVEIKRTIDDKINMAIQKLYDFCYDNRIIKFASRRDFYEPSAIMDALDVISFSNNACITHKQIEDIFIYFNNTNVILNRMAYYSPEEYYLSMEDFKLGFDEWILLLQSYKNFDFLIAPAADKDVIILKSIPLTGKTDTMALVGIRLSGDAIVNTLNSLTTINSMHTYVVTNSGEVISHSKNALNEGIAFLPDIYEKRSGIYYDKIHKVESIITFEKSSYSDWNYVSVVPVNVIMRELNSFRIMTSGIVFFFLLFSVLLIMYVKRKSYGPVKRLIANIKSNYFSEEDTHTNEIQIIADTLERLSREREEIKKNMTEQYPVIRNNMLISLVKEIEVNDSMQDKMAAMDIRFQYEEFVVLCIDIEEASEFEPIKLNGDRVLIKTIITNIAQDVFRIVGEIYMIEFNWDKMVMIINSNRNSDEVCEMVYKCAQELMTLLEKLFSLIVTIGISQCGKGINNIGYLYQEAEDALTYKLLSGIHTVNQFKKLEFNTNNYFYPTYMEHKLINSVAVGNEVQALEIVQTIFTNNFKRNSQPVKYSKCLFFDIISTVLKLLNEIKIDFSDIFDNRFDTEKELLDCKTVDEMHDVVCEIVVKICRYVNSKAKSKNDKLITSIIDYINENYCSESICIGSIAEAVDITQPYLSHYFKEKIGNSVMKYIEQLRIEKTKQLLRNTNLTLAEITQETGFSNSAVLIRTFKKKEGITPGQYRELE